SLQKGQACAYCRRRKMASKCDGRRPVCGPCLRGCRPDDCEYTDSHNRSRAEILEEDISRIESRIYELEHPAQGAGGSVPLHHPYSQLDLRPKCTAYHKCFTPQDLSVCTFLALHIDTFLPYASDWGFFLDPTRFRHDALLPLPIGHHSRPTPALLTAIYLVGIALSDSPALRIHEKPFLSRALSSLSISLSGMHPRKAIHTLQTEIILSNYFYASGRFLEGRYHTTAAVSLVVSSALLKPESSTGTIWPNARTAESLDACWTTIILDKSWAIALTMPPNFNDEGCNGMLELPFPADSTPVRGDTIGYPRFYPIQQSSNSQPPSTVAQFLDGTEICTNAASAKILLAKATVLWERANNLVVGWKSGTPSIHEINSHANMFTDMNPDEYNQFSNAFSILDIRIHDFHNNLATAPAPNSRALVFGHSIAHAAVIQLHRPFTRMNPISKQKCSAAAKSILILVTDAALRASVFINPVM
ncbi:hypothetical protein B0H17DRAFT_909120, partial [Mycena rosella]